MRSSLVSIVFIAIVLSTSGSVFAQQQDNDAVARERYSQGDAAYAEGRYEAALSLFQEAFDLSARPALLYNLANTLERLGRGADAVARLRQFLPNAPENLRTIVEHRIAALDEREARRAQQEAERVRSEEAERERLANATVTVRPATSSSTAPAARSAARSENHWGGPIALYGVALVGAALAVTFGILAQQADSRARSNCRTLDGVGTLCRDDASSDLSQARTFAPASDVSTGVAAVAFVGAVLWTISQVRATHAEHPHLPVAFAPTPNGFVLAGEL